MRHVRSLALLCSVTGLMTVSSGVAVAQDSWPIPGWIHVDDLGAAGWSPEGLRRARRFADSVGTAAYMVVEGGRVVDTYGDVTHPFRAHSVRKSLLSVLYGIAADRGHVSFDATLAELGIDDYARLTRDERRAELGHLLQSRSGVYLPAAYENEAFDRVRPERGSHGPGEHWFYSNWDFNTAGTAYQLLTGRNLFTAFRDEIAGPLGMQDFALADVEWRYDTRSWHPAYLFRISSRDLARVGLLYLRGGRWKDRRLVPKAWVTRTTVAVSEVTRPDGTPMPGTCYGWMWWVPCPEGDPGPIGAGVFSAVGTGEQVLSVVPERDLVFVHRTDTDLPSSEFRSVGHPKVMALLERVLEAKPGSETAAASTGGTRSGVVRTHAAASPAIGDTVLDAVRLPTPTAPELPGDVVALPNPEGPFQIGTATYGLRLAEPEPLTDDPDDRRGVVVQLFYPARRTEDGAPAAYLPRIDDMRRGLREHGFPPFAELAARLDRYERVQTHAWPDEPVLSREGPFPVVLFSPGGNTSRHWYTGYYEELASHGYVVAAMSHAHSGLDVFPKAGFLASHVHWHPGSDVPADERAARDDELSARLAADARATLDFLTELQAGRCPGDAPGRTGSPSRACGPEGIRGALDLGRTALAGHSRGGSTVTRGCATDSRLDACVVLDNIGSEPETREGLGRPQLAVRAPWPEERAGRLHRFLAANRTQAFEVVLPGAVHMSFTDLPLIDPEGQPPGELAPLDAHRTVSTVTLGFLDRYLGNRRGAFRAALAVLGDAVAVTAF